MPIAALPPSTAQAIGSSSILPDPCSAVKELVDNGLDAGATSISVEISQNTLDVITVKDNGHGIAPADFDHVCKRAYTSKIQTLDDLRNLGGQSLGFRGVALASAADMADNLTVTTRTKREIVASVLKYDRRGQLVSTEKASHAVGTTVCLTGFLKNVPVRRQTAVKNASKTITKLKKLLQAYAIARPVTRLSFKVLHSKNEKDNWTYAPSSTANVTDASRKVVGVEIAGQCICKSWPEDIDEESNASIKLFAYLPKADAEPAKDDVLFAERDELLKLSGEFFKSIYGELDRNPEVTEKPSAPVNGFNLLLRQPAAQEPISPPSTNHVPTVINNPRPTDEIPQTNLQISTPSEDVLSDVGNDETLSHDNSLNPWSITKTNFFNRLPQSSRADQFVTPTRQSSGRQTAGKHAEAIQSSHSEISSPHSQLSSAEVSHSLPQRSSSTSVREFRSSKGFPEARRRDRERHGNGSLEAWFMNNNGPTLRIEQASDLIETESVMLDDFDTDDLIEYSPGIVSKPFRIPLPHEKRDFTNRSRRPLHSPDIESLGVSSPERGQSSPVMEERASSLHRASEISNSQETERALDFERRKREANIAHRQQLQDRQRYLNTPASSQSTSNSPHHNRYLAAKAALSQHNQQNQPVLVHRQKGVFYSTDRVQEIDPRVYLMRHQAEHQKESFIPQANNVTRPATERIPTNRLPLEKIPHGFGVHNLGLTLDIPRDTRDLAKQCKHMVDVDFYVSGREAEDIDVDFHSFNPLHNPHLPEICKVWETKLANLIKGQYRPKDVDLCSASGGSDDALLENLDIFAAINSMNAEN
ncbi:hypothetical protein UA08_06074 [Talaromyces atroroseus]|uniref:DNA mismatch repair protein S5 domain-containing protein n=1 Tax=Talaromyces atroroseus TaxID=1441469 RepID=A0A225AJF8_TALAT|nr:hypothetical protein UA08_06074 [Talaromyces atroroseus]OKL58384.1 hypothetical protein UA08_06074 [Talaromyces atroroseus]